MTLSSLFLFAACLIGLLSVMILLYHCLMHRYCTVPLILNLGVVTIWVFHRFLIDSALIIQVPHLFRFSTPLAVLAGPTFYLYIRGVINGEVRWHNRNWKHLLPGLLIFVLLLPFFMKSAEEKSTHLNFLFDNPYEFAVFHESVLPPFIQHILNAAIVIIYIFLGIRLLLAHLVGTAAHLEVIRPGTRRWILAHGLVLILLAITVLTAVASKWISMYSYVYVLNALAAALILPVFSILFFNPAILYGLTDEEFQEIKTLKNPRKANPGAPYVFDAHTQAGIKSSLESYMENSKAYLQRNLTLPHLSSMLQVSRHQLSYVINKEYGSNFNEYINQLRIDHCLGVITLDQWRNYTLEAIARECGFGSRQSFIKAFKKNVNVLPSDYRASLLGGKVD